MELILEHVTKHFKDVTAVNDISCCMGKGVFGLLGVNGAGKTTLMRMICGLIQPDEGRIICNGRKISDMGGEYRRLLGYLPQEFGYYPDFSAEDYLLYIASLKGLKPGLAKKRTTELLARVSLEKVRKKKIKTFSGGMKRRLGIAQAMLNDPHILILDEPTAGLDPNERIRFRNLISEMAQERLVLLSTHIVSDVESIANEIILMKNGVFTHNGAVDQLMASVPVKAWKVIVHQEDVKRVVNHYKTVSRKQTDQGIELRLLSEEVPENNAVSDRLTLEDIFLYYYGEESFLEDGIL